MDTRNPESKDDNFKPPAFVKDIKMPNSHIPFDITQEYVPQNPYSLESDATSLGKSSFIKPEEHKPSFFQTAKAEAYEFHTTAKLLHYAYNKQTGADPFSDVNPNEDPRPAGWTPKSNAEMFLNVRPEYIKPLLEASGPKAQQKLYQQILAEQQHDDALANGSMTAKVLGGLAGIITDPISYIPIVGWAKYAKFAPTFLSSSLRAAPGMATFGVLNSAGKELDKVNGNLEDFFKDAFIQTTFGTVLFGGLGTASLAADRLELWRLKDFAKDHIDGIDFKLHVDDAGKVTGIKAIDTTGSLSAARVDYAQQLADSSFHKSGLFKIPYLGEAVKKFIGMPIIGSPMINLFNSQYQTMRGFIDRVASHGFITKGVAEGKAAPQNFSNLMNQEMSGLRAMQTQIDALHLERNGFDIKSRPLQQVTGLYQEWKNKALQSISDDVEKNGYISKEKYYSEIEQVLITKTPSEHSSINEAASIFREKIDNTYKAWRKAYNLPEDWLPPKTAEGYLMRVYDTPYLNGKEKEWVGVVSNWLRDSDELISKHMEPLEQLKSQIKESTVLGESKDKIRGMRSKLKAMQSNLENELRTNPELQLHVHDWNALSSDESKQLKQLLDPLKNLEKEFDAQKQLVAKSKAKNAKLKLKELESKLEVERERLQELAHSGQINPRFYKQDKDSFNYVFKDPAERLKFRDRYESHFHREAAAKAYYDTIMHQTPEQTIAQTMGRFTGISSENPLKARTLLLPDKLLYENKFMSKDLMAKTSNYVSYLARRTHLKNVFSDITHDGGIEPLLRNINEEYQGFRAPLNKKLEDLMEKEQTQAIKKEIKSIEKKLDKERKQFNKVNEEMQNLYNKMMGIHNYSRKELQGQSAIMSFTAMANLPFVAFSMINDLSSIGLQHGIWPFIRDGMYPMIESFAGLRKTADSEGLRNAAASVDLALSDVLNGYADRNWSMQTNPYLNLGKIANTLQSLAHLNTNFTLTNYLDNGLQHLAGGIVQSELMRILHAFSKGKMTDKEGLYIRQYGIDPKIWADRMIKASKEGGASTTKLGGHNSMFWQWQDLEASNKFADAVYRGIQNTIISRGIADAPFWADTIIGRIINGFAGWTFASVNRYVVPSLQNPDINKLGGVMMSLALGALVDPMRRLARGEDPIPENQTEEQQMFSAFQNSGYFSFFSTVLADANLLSGDKLLGDLKNDKYKDRTRAGLLGPAWGTANRLFDVIGALASNEMNEADAKKMARMIPFANASWTWLMSKTLIEHLGLPKTRAEAQALKEL